MEGLSKLKPVLEGGVTTAGNASGKNDGAAFVLMMTAEKAKELGYEPMARWVIGADVGVEPRYMGIGPAFSSLKALKMAGPVSYTHLDVYKRQCIYRSGSDTMAAGIPSRVTAAAMALVPRPRSSISTWCGMPCCSAQVRSRLL